MKDVVKQLRAKTGLSQSKFAEYVGVPVRTIQHWEQGFREPQGWMVNLVEFVVEHGGIKENNRGEKN